MPESAPSAATKPCCFRISAARTARWFRTLADHRRGAADRRRRDSDRIGPAEAAESGPRASRRKPSGSRASARAPESAKAADSRGPSSFATVAPGACGEVAGEVIDHVARVVLGAVDEGRLAAPEHRQADRVQPRRIDDAAVVPQVALCDRPPARRASCSRAKSGRPDDRPDLAARADRDRAATTPARASARSAPAAPTSASRAWLRAHSSNVSSSRSIFRSASAN